MTPALRLIDLTRHFGRVRAVDGINLEVGEGACFGLVGPNGSGKTTTLRMVSSLQRPTRGSARICGFDLEREAHRIRPLLGVVFHECTLDPDISVAANLDLYLRLRDTPRAVRKARADEMLALCELEEVRARRAGDLSWGYRRRVEIARALCGHPRLLLLDEPTVGLDAEARQGMLRVLNACRRREGATVFVCTHDAQLMDACDQIGILSHGRLRHLEPVQALRSRFRINDVTITPAPDSPENSAQILAQLEAEGLHPHLRNGQICIQAPHVERWLPPLLARLGPRIESMSYAPTSLGTIVTQLLLEADPTQPPEAMASPSPEPRPC